MKKILILQNTIFHYRKPFYNKLAEKYDVTVLHSGKASLTEVDFYKEIIVPVKNLYKFKFQKGVFKEVKKPEYEVVIAMMDIFWIKNVISSFIYPKKTKFVWWGIIAGKSSLGNKLRGTFLRRKPTIFYAKSGLEELASLGFKNNNYTFCNNTFHIENRIECYKETAKDSILFVGSLDRRKRIDVLIKAFNQSLAKIPQNINLKIIGDGEDYNLASDLIKSLNISNRVQLEGRITETKELENYYRKAICSVSYGQAGLGVLQSLGYGVPFITSKNAISGGEISNILHEVNGILCEPSQNSLEDFIVKLSNDLNWSKSLGKNAFEHYSQKSTIEHMASKFSKVIEF